MTEQQTDPAAATVAKVKQDHQQHVCTNHPQPGICVSRCPADRWPCAPYRAALAVEAALAQHRRSLTPAYGMGSGDGHGKHYCAGLCHVSINHDTVWEPWPCFPYLEILAALTGTTVVDLTVRQLANHDVGCGICQDLKSRPAGLTRCGYKADLAARWRRALREAGRTPDA